MTKSWRQFHGFFGRSIFLKLFVVYLLTAVVLLGGLRAFKFWTLDERNFFQTPWGRILAHQANYLLGEIGSPPDPEKAKRIAEEWGVQIRVEGAGASWSTDSRLPSIPSLRIHGSHAQSPFQASRFRFHPVIIANDDAQRVALFFSHRPSRNVDAWMLTLLIGMIAAVLTGSYWGVRWFLRPVGWLNVGAKEIAKGNFDHQVPVRSPDEFGRLAASFNDMAQQVREMIRARDRLLVDVSHELRSPLTRMKVAIEFIQDPSSKEKLQQELRELETMVAELLESERLTSQGGQLDLVATDLVSIVKEVVGAYALQGAGVRLVASPGRVVLSLDRQRAHIVFRNLLENAIKYSPREKGPIEIRITVETDFVCIAIRDHGPGIPLDEQSRIFEPFYRVDPSRTRETGGYGLGLNLVKKIMEAHGGEVVLSCSSDIGSTFILKFPIR
ncbi:MAG: HAMP domain-containing sensor histidine kinase [Nitrospira sp.]|nr:HAMP domain-containing sensor histidine kinase [Nitrospira sp.]